MKKKLRSLQSYWKWYGIAMTIFASISCLRCVAMTHRTRHARHRHTSTARDHIELWHELVNESLTDALRRSQLERVPPIPNTTEFHFENSKEKSDPRSPCSRRKPRRNRNRSKSTESSRWKRRQRRGKRDGDGGGKAATDFQRVEVIKQQILSKLGLSASPNVSAVNGKMLEALSIEQLPISLHDSSTVVHSTPKNAANVETEIDDFYGRTSEIIEFAEPGFTLNGQKLLEFSWSQDMAASEVKVKKATLWVRLELNRDLSWNNYHRANDAPFSPNVTFWLLQISGKGESFNDTSYLSGKEFEERTKLSAKLQVSFSSLGWKTFDVTSTVREWAAQASASAATMETAASADKLRLLVECSGCGDQVTPVLFDDPRQANKYEKPFLLIHTEPMPSRRRRRTAIDCSLAKQHQCCKQQFYIRFKDIGWHTWILAPSGYYANYCRGDCGGFHRTPDTYLNAHSYAVDDYKKIHQYSLFEPCCAPVKFSSISLIYITPDNNIVKRDLPKMVVDECGCP